MKRTFLSGLFFWIVLILSSSFGIIFMVVPLLPLLFINPSWFRKLADLMITFYLVFAVSLMEFVYGIKVVLTGDQIDSSNSANNLIIMNHRTRLDWMFFWCSLYRHSYLNFFNQKISLKEFPLKNLLGLGWATQFAAYIFMKRNFEQDKITIAQMLSYYRRVHQDVNIVYFPEGTDKCPNSTERSQAFADKNNLPQYEYVIHPRVTGFSFLCQQMMKGNFDSLYDVTVAYNDTIPQDEKAILMGEFPDEVHFHVKRYTAKQLPDEEEGLQEFCKGLWKEKEQRLSDFYTKSHRFTDEDKGSRSVQCDTPRRVWQIIALIYWFPFLFLSVYFTLSSSVILGYVMICFVGLSAAGPLFGGFDALQAKL